MASTIWAGTGTSSVAVCDPTDERQAVALSDPAEVDLHLYRGDSGRFRVSVTMANGTPVNIAGATWDCDVRVSEDAVTPIATLLVTPVSGAVNVVEVAVSDVQSALITDGSVWDLQMTLGGEVQTIVRGRVYVTKDVSRPVVP